MQLWALHTTVPELPAVPAGHGRATCQHLSLCSEPGHSLHECSKLLGYQGASRHSHHHWRSQLGDLIGLVVVKLVSEGIILDQQKQVNIVAKVLTQATAP